MKLLFLVLLAVSLIAVSSFAAPRGSVVVNPANKYASGSLGGARGSGEENQYFGCSLSSAGYAFCSARDSNGVSAACFTTDPNMMQVIGSIKDDSFVYFTWAASGVCLFVNVGNASYNRPK